MGRTEFFQKTTPDRFCASGVISVHSSYLSSFLLLAFLGLPYSVRTGLFGLRRSSRFVSDTDTRYSSQGSYVCYGITEQLIYFMRITAVFLSPLPVGRSLYPYLV